MDPTVLGPRIDIRPLFPVERAALLDLLAGLGPVEWERPTVCPGWIVKDVAAHVLGDDLGRLARTRDGFLGTTPAAGESLLAFINRINDEWVVAARRLSPAQVVGLLRSTGPQIAAMWDDTDIDALGEPVSWAARGPAPVWLDAARDLSECWTHQQQIRDATGRPPLDDPALLGPVLDTFLRALPATLAEVRAAPGTTVELAIDGPAGGSWFAERHQDVWSLVPGPSHPTAASVRLDADTAWRLCTRGITPQDARQRAEIVGDFHLANAMLQIVSAIV